MAKVLICLALFCLVAICYVQAQIPGGLNNELPADEEVRKIVTSMHSLVERKANMEIRELEPISYRKQIVAGANYFVRALATGKDGTQSQVHLRIYKPFRGPLELTAIRTNMDRQKPLDYFD